MEIVFKPNPSFSLSEAKDLAKAWFGVAGTARELPSERDQNFLLTTQDGNKYILKIANPGDEKVLLDFQNKAIEYISSQGKGEIVPALLSTKDGETIKEIEKDMEKFYVRLLTFLPGKTLANITPRTPTLLFSLGNLMGRIDKALVGFSHPAAKRALKWDTKNALWIKDYINHIHDSERKRIVQYFLTEFETRVIPAFQDLRTSVIHNDGNDHNILVDDSDPLDPRATGIIDFGDMVETHTIFELATTIAYAIFNCDDPLTATAQIAKGYHEVIPLTDLEIELLYWLICIRLCVSVTNTAYQKTLQPDNEYLVISENSAWEALEKLYKIDADLARETFRRCVGNS